MSLIRNLGDKIMSSWNLDKTAIIDTGKIPHLKFSYRSLDALANGVANGLTVKNFKRGMKCAIVAENSAEYLAVYYGILRAGLVVVPLNIKYPAETIKNILDQSECSIVFCTSDLKHLIPDHLPVISFGLELSNFIKPGYFTAVVPKEDEAALLMFTSGSSDKPRGVVISHKNFGWKIMKTAHEVGAVVGSPEFLHLACGPLYHMNALSSSEVILASHGTLVLLPRFNAAAVAESIDQYKIKSISCVPTVLALLFKDLDIDKFNLSSVKFVNSASAPLTQNLISLIKKYFFNALDGIQNNYGLTEVGPRLFGRHPTNKKRPELSVGYPIPGIEYRIVDRVLQIKSPSVMKEYYKNSELSQKNTTADGFYITNDLFEIDDDGFYYFLGRADDMIVCGGENIYLSSIEQILEKHHAINLAIAVPLEDDIKGLKPYAFIELKNNSMITEGEVQQLLTKHLPYYAHPRKIWKMTQVPVTGTNKIDILLLKNIARNLLLNPELKDYSFIRSL